MKKFFPAYIVTFWSLYNLFFAFPQETAQNFEKCK
jgi:hypothetical protein